MSNNNDYELTFTGLTKQQQEDLDHIRQMLIRKGKLSGGGNDDKKISAYDRKKDDEVWKRLSVHNEDGSYSQIPESEWVESKQEKYPVSYIREKLQKYETVTVRELFDDVPNSSWIRYFMKTGEYRTGGFMVYKDPEERYVTLKCTHNATNPNVPNQTVSWNMQIENIQTIYVRNEVATKFRSIRLDKIRGFNHGVSNMLNQEFIDHKTTGEYVAYDYKDNVIYSRTTLSTFLSILNNKRDPNSAEITNSDINRNLEMADISQQIQNPIGGRFFITRQSSDDVKRIKGKKGRIKKK